MGNGNARSHRGQEGPSPPKKPSATGLAGPWGSEAVATRALGIDPGTAVLGYGVVEEAGGRLRALDRGAFRTEPGRAPEDRLFDLYENVRALLAAWRPDRVAVEQVYFKRNVTSALAVGQARGVVLLAARQAGVPVAEFPPHAVKLAVSGNGRAEKQQVQRMVRVLLGLSEDPRPDDVADALAVAICGIHNAGAAALDASREASSLGSAGMGATGSSSSSPATASPGRTGWTR